MKHFLCLMGPLCPLSNPYKTKLSAMLAVMSLFMCLIAAFKAPAQTGAAANMDEIQPLQIGDTIPEELWHLPLQVVNHPEGKETITLNDYRDSELLILEFWGFPCSGCIQAINNLDSIKDAFEANQIAMLPVHVLPFEFDDSKTLKNAAVAATRNEWSTPSVVQDTMLKRLFTRYLPNWGDVWIHKGRLLAVPVHGYVSHEAIAAVLDGEFVDFQNRHNAPSIDPFQPILTNGNGEGRILYASDHSRIAGYIPHHSTMPLTLEYRGDSTFLFTWNRTLSELLYEAYRPDIMEYLNVRTGVIWETESVECRLTELEDNTVTSFERVLARETWNNDNLYGYQLYVAGTLTEADARRIMQLDAEAFAHNHLGIQPKVKLYGPYRFAVLEIVDEELTRKILDKESKQRRIAHTDNTYNFHHYHFSTFTRNVYHGLGQVGGLGLTIHEVVNRTGISMDTPVSFTFEKHKLDSGDFKKLQEMLEGYGMKLTIKEKKLPILFVQDLTN